MNRNKKRATLLGLASSLFLSLTACDTQTLNISLNSSEDYIESQESTDSLQTEEEQLFINDQLVYKEDDLDNEYQYSDLYVLNTGLMGAEISKYYIVKRITRFGTDIREIAYKCEPKNCYYAEEDLKDKYNCYAIIYETIGLEENQTIYSTSHYPDDFYNEIIYLGVNNYLFTLEPGGIENNASNEKIFQNFDNTIAFISSVINPDDLKFTYTEAQLIKLMTKMNSGNYEFNEEYVQKSSLSK